MVKIMIIAMMMKHVYLDFAFHTLRHLIPYEDEFENTYNYPIRFCPHCGEKIEIAVVNEIDMSDRYNELTKQHDEIWNKYEKMDSDKEKSGLRK